MRTEFPLRVVWFFPVRAIRELCGRDRTVLRFGVHLRENSIMKSADITLEMAEMVVGWGGNRPAGISLSRWNAIVKFVLCRTV